MFNYLQFYHFYKPFNGIQKRFTLEYLNEIKDVLKNILQIQLRYERIFEIILLYPIFEL